MTLLSSVRHPLTYSVILQSLGGVRSHLDAIVKARFGSIFSIPLCLQYVSSPNPTPGARTLSELGISREEAGAYIKRYFERFPGIRAYMDQTKQTVRERGYVTTIFGRKCHYPRVTASNPSERAFNERAAINAPIQGSAADIIRRAMIRMDDALEKAKLSTNMLLQVHDELVFEVPDAEIAATRKAASARCGAAGSRRGGVSGAVSELIGMPQWHHG
jgi:DNA polymerase family A